MAISQGKVVLGCMSVLGLCAVSGAVLVAVAPDVATVPAEQAPQTAHDRARALLEDAHHDVAHAFDSSEGDILVLKANLERRLEQIEAIDPQVKAQLAPEISKVRSEIKLMLKQIRPAVRLAGER